MDIDNFEWWYSEGEAPDEEWDEPMPRDVSSDEDETGNDVAADSDAALDPVEPLTFEQAWAQAEADEAKADATATLGEPADMSIPTARHPSVFSTCPRRVPRRPRPHVAPICLARKMQDVALRLAPSLSPSWPALSHAR